MRTLNIGICKTNLLDDCRDLEPLFPANLLGGGPDDAGGGAEKAELEDPPMLAGGRKAPLLPSTPLWLTPLLTPPPVPTFDVGPLVVQLSTEL